MTCLSHHFYYSDLAKLLGFEELAHLISRQSTSQEKLSTKLPLENTFSRRNELTAFF